MNKICSHTYQIWSYINNLCIAATCYVIKLLPYSWKFLRDKNFEVFADFNLSSKIKTSNNKIIGFKIIACTSKIYSQKVGKK